MQQIHTYGVRCHHSILRIAGVCSFVSLTLMPSPAAGQERVFEVESAYHEGTTVQFGAGPDRDWEAYVSQELWDIPIPTTDPAVLAELLPLIDAYGSAQVSESVPVPTLLSEQRYYFVGSTGLEPFEPDSASVTVRFSFNFRQNRVIDRVIWGDVYSGPLARSSEGGGFVLRSKQPRGFEIRPSGFTADDLLLGGSTAARTSDGGYEGRGTAFWSIVVQYQFSLLDARGVWVFVQWKADDDLFEVGCQHRYSLFKLDEAGGPPTQVAWTSYGCDV